MTASSTGTVQFMLQTTDRVLVRWLGISYCSSRTEVDRVLRGLMIALTTPVVLRTMLLCALNATPAKIVTQLEATIHSIQIKKAVWIPSP